MPPCPNLKNTLLLSQVKVIGNICNRLYQDRHEFFNVGNSFYVYKGTTQLTFNFLGTFKENRCVCLQSSSLVKFKNAR